MHKTPIRLLSGEEFCAFILSIAFNYVLKIGELYNTFVFPGMAIG